MKNLNDIKVISLGSHGLNAAPVANSTSILVIDKAGEPLVGAHLKWTGGGVITDQHGEAHVSVPSEGTVITITYMGKRDHVAKFSDLVNAMITMQDQTNNLPPVVVGSKPMPVTGMPLPTATTKKTNWTTTAAIGLGLVLLVAMMAKKKGSGLNAPKPKKARKKKTGKAKKSKGLREPFFDPAVIDL